VAGPCDHCNELSGYVKGVDFLYQLSDNQLLKEDSAPWS
jgi:hypothetical protein